jgi:2-polyprenyl-3-methyl-5-hydroxy-6-metoxy-1,4-benzoquinol methylase
MDKANQFLKDFYERDHQYAISKGRINTLTISDPRKHKNVIDNLDIYKEILPKDKEEQILEIGFGEGWFIGICLELGYRNITVADFDAQSKIENLDKGLKKYVKILNINETIIDTLSSLETKYRFVHFSHVVEHIPKYDLINLMVALKKILLVDSSLLIRTPNMLSPVASHLYFSTLGHENGFSPTTIRDLINVSGYKSYEFISPLKPNKNIKVFFGNILRSTLLKLRSIEYRLLIGQHPISLDAELIILAKN